MYRDYRDKDVQFFYVYKALAHPEINNFVSAFTIEERLMHIARAKSRFKSEIPWICDRMNQAFEEAFGGSPNGEYILDPEGKIVRKRFWSNPKTLRSDLEELVGKVDKITTVEDLPTAFEPKPREIASGVVPRLDLPRGLATLKMKPVPDDDHPFFAKLRAEGTRELTGTKRGKLYFGVYLDPIHEVHWNNRAGRVTIEIEDNGAIKTDEMILTSEEVEEDADIDPRQFLINANVLDHDKPMLVNLTYTVCDDDETFCTKIIQQYKFYFELDTKYGTRPGIFMNSMFFDVRKLDTNGDGDLTINELPAGKTTLYIGHLDYNGNEIIESEEIDRFLKMFNNGKGMTQMNDGELLRK